MCLTQHFRTNIIHTHSHTHTRQYLNPWSGEELSGTLTLLLSAPGNFVEWKHSVLEVKMVVGMFKTRTHTQLRVLFELACFPDDDDGNNKNLVSSVLQELN